MTSEKAFDLEDRLLDHSAEVIRVVERLPNTRAGNHVVGQLLSSGTSPFAHHGEAQSAESRRDFIHKMRVCLKELREAKRRVSIELRLTRESQSASMGAVGRFVPSRSVVE